jgi:hypothetical protein
MEAIGGRAKMRTTIVVSTLVIASAVAQAQTQNPPEVKLLTPTDCSQITKRPQGDFYVKGPIRIGGMLIQNSNVPPHGMVMNGIDNFDVIQRSCFNGKPT